MSLTFGAFCPIHSGGFTKRETSGTVDLTWEEAKSVTLRAESLGFEYELIAARWYGPVLEPWTTTAALASITSTIHLLVAVHSGMVQPQLAAKMGANIDQISGGRFHINLVSGSDDQQFQHKMYGGLALPHDERYELSEEYIRIVKGMWTNQPFSYDGKYYQLEDVDLRPKPVQRPVPTTFLGGQSEPARELAANECDWYFITGLDLDEILALRDDVAQRAKARGRELRFAISGMIMVRDSDTEAEKEIEALNVQAETDRTVRTHARSLRAGLWGTPERIAERLSEFSRHGFEMVLLQGRALDQDLTQFADQVIPLLPRVADAKYLTVQ